MTLVRSAAINAAVALLAFAVLAAALLSRPEKRLNDFDQSFYLTIAYDLDRWGVFSNGMFDETDSTQARPRPGMFMAPLYPLLAFAVMQASRRFREAVICNVEANHQRRSFESCAIYARPMLLVHAAFLAAGVIAIGFAAQLMFRRRAALLAAAAVATAGLLMEAELFSFVMTESVTFGLYSLTALFLLRAWQRRHPADWLLAGVLFGLLCLDRVSHLVLLPALWCGALLARYGLRHAAARGALGGLALFTAAFAVTVAPWLLRNAVSVGKLAFTEEYGAAAVIERLAYNDMREREFFLAFPYCVPEIGPAVVDALFGPATMARFDWRSPGGFFDAGRTRRTELAKQYGRLDPVVARILGKELKQNGWRHLAVSLPLAWCGLWVAKLWSLIFIPVLGAALYRAVRRRRLDFLLYSAPPLVMLALHGAIANHYPRYNLILIGPAAAGAAWFAAGALTAWRRRGCAASTAPRSGA